MRLLRAILFLWVALTARTAMSAIDFIGEVRASNYSGKLVIPTNFFAPNVNLYAGSNIFLQSTGKTGLLIHGQPGSGGGTATATNAVVSVSSNGVTVAASASTNLNFCWDGNILLRLTNVNGNVSIGVYVLSNNFQAAKLLLSNLVNNPYTGWTNQEIATASGKGTNNSLVTPLLSNPTNSGFFTVGSHWVIFQTANNNLMLSNTAIPSQVLEWGDNNGDSTFWGPVSNKLTLDNGGIIRAAAGVTVTGGAFVGNGSGVTNLPTSLTNATHFDLRAGFRGLKTLSASSGAILLTDQGGTNLDIGAGGGGGGGAGEANVNGEVSLTNASRYGWVNGKAGITNLLRSFQPANGVKGTNESGTNISLAIDPAVVASQTDLTGESNALRTTFIANDTTTSNGIIAQLGVAAYSNAQAFIASANGKGTNTTTRGLNETMGFTNIGYTLLGNGGPTFFATDGSAGIGNGAAGYSADGSGYFANSKTTWNTDGELSVATGSSFIGTHAAFFADDAIEFNTYWIAVSAITPFTKTNIGQTIDGVIGGTNLLELRGTNKNSAFGPNGGLHIGGLSAVAGNNLLVEGTITGSGIGVTNLLTSLTNSTHFDPTAGSKGLKTYGSGWGLVLTNETGTNLVYAVDPALIPSQMQLTLESNALVSLLVANDTTSSNGLRTTFIANDTTTSNGVVALVGETNWNGEVSVTNGTRIGWVNGKSNNTNLLRSAQGGNGVVLTNQGTNVMLAIDPAVVASQSDLTTASNTLNTRLVSNDTTTSNGLVTFIYGQSGRTNYNGEVSKTNGSMYGWVYDQLSDTNRLRSFAPRNGLVGTNESGTNISVAIDPAVVFSQANGTALSNEFNTRLVSLGSMTLGNVPYYGGSLELHYDNSLHFDPNNNSGFGPGALISSNFAAAGQTGTGDRPAVWSAAGGLGSKANGVGVFTNDGAGVLGWMAVPSGLLGGNSGAVQFNQGGALAGTNDFEWDRTNNQLKVNGFLRVTNAANASSVGASNGAVYAASTNLTGATVPSGLTASNATLALTNSQANTPAITLSGSAFSSPGGGVAGGASNITWRVFGTNIQAATPTSTLKFGYSILNGAETYPMTLSSAGQINTLAAISSGSSVVAQGANGFQFSGRSIFLSAADGAIEVANNGNNDFTKFQFGGTTIAFPALGRTNGDLVMFGADGLFAGANTNRFFVEGGLGVGQKGQTTLAKLHVTNSTTVQVAARVDQQGTTNDVEQWVNNNNRVAIVQTNGLVVGSGYLDPPVARVGGVLTNSGAGNYTNLNGTPATFTNLMSYTVPANLLTNLGDCLYARWGSKMKNAAANTNDLKVIYGSTTVLDTGLQIASNGTWWAECYIWRTGNSAQHCEVTLNWDNCAGRPFASTNANLELAENNGVANIIKMQGAAQAVGAHTNTSLMVTYNPTP